MWDRNAASVSQFGKAEDAGYVKATGILLDYARYLASWKRCLNTIIDDDKIEEIFFRINRSFNIRSGSSLPTTV